MRIGIGPGGIDHRKAVMPRIGRRRCIAAFKPRAHRVDPAGTGIGAAENAAEPAAARLIIVAVPALHRQPHLDPDRRQRGGAQLAIGRQPISRRDHIGRGDKAPLQRQIRQAFAIRLGLGGCRTRRQQGREHGRFRLSHGFLPVTGVAAPYRGRMAGRSARRKRPRAAGRTRPIRRPWQARPGPGRARRSAFRARPPRPWRWPS
jgi:hypothetical protein